MVSTKPAAAQTSRRRRPSCSFWTISRGITSLCSAQSNSSWLMSPLRIAPSLSPDRVRGDSHNTRQTVRLGFVRVHRLQSAGRNGWRCSLVGAKRTLRGHVYISENDTNRTFATAYFRANHGNLSVRCPRLCALKLGVSVS